LVTLGRGVFFLVALGGDGDCFTKTCRLRRAKQSHIIGVLLSLADHVMMPELGLP